MEPLADSNQSKICLFKTDLSKFSAESKKPVKREEPERKRWHTLVPKNLKASALSRKEKYYLLWNKGVK